MANLFMMAAAAHEAAEPAAFGVLPAPWIVAAAMAVLLIVALVLKVPAAAAKGLDASIAEIKKQLDEGKALRAEAEKLRADYTARVAGAEKEALQLVEHAKTEAAAIVAKAQADTSAVIARREKMASDKIEASERAAVAELRESAARAAAVAAGSLIASQYGAGHDKVQVDAAIAGL
jgi:F-type H+-transporting ATPase subunit b